jgi:hypothetical protein
MLSPLWRRVRGVLGTASIWLVSWAGLGALYFLVDFTRYVRVPEVRSQLFSGLVAFGLIWAIWGAISGIVYGVSLSVTQRGRMLGQLQARHLAFWGALAGASYPGFIWVSSLLSPNSVWLSDLPLATALGAVAGAASACGSLWIAKRAEARVLLQPPPAVETPTAQSREDQVEALYSAWLHE